MPNRMLRFCTLKPLQLPAGKSAWSLHHLYDQLSGLAFESMKRIQLTKLLMAIGICVAFAILGGLLTGDALESWFAQLRQPWFALPMWGWYLVGGLYYIMAIVILYRLLSTTASPDRAIAIWLTIAMVAGNEFWNYLFFGLQSTYWAFLGLLPFSLVVAALFFVLWRWQRTTARILLPYLIWLVYDLLWTYQLWQLNGVG